MSGVYSPYIDLAILHAAQLGCRVAIVDHLPSDCAGRYTHAERSIRILGSLPARDALLTVAHEIGHHIGYARHPGGEHRAKGLREREAYAYGWHVLVAIGAPVMRSEWLSECREAAYWRIAVRIAEEHDQ